MENKRAMEIHAWPDKQNPYISGAEWLGGRDGRVGVSVRWGEGVGGSSGGSYLPCLAVAASFCPTDQRMTVVWIELLRSHVKEASSSCHILLHTMLPP